LGGLRWVTAAELISGDVLKTLNDEIVLNSIKEKNGTAIVYNLSVPNSRIYLVGEVGLVVGDISGRRELSAPDFDEDSYSGGGCFPAGTSVLTDDGLFPIEGIETGDMVRSYDFPNGSWTFARVNNLISRDYSGDIISLKAGGSDITTTGNHPFLVMSGESLDGRPPAADVPLMEQNSPNQGRWVEARHIRTEDQLLTPRGEKTVTSHTSSQGRLTVYNLTVAGMSNYTVGTGAFLVHNKGEAERKSELDSDKGGYGFSEGEIPLPEELSRESFSTAGGGTSGLRAGFADDNAQYGYFLRFLEEYAPRVSHHPIDISERIILKVKDRAGLSLPDTQISIRAGAKELARGQTYADGTFLFFPSEYDSQIDSFEVTASYRGRSETLTVDRKGGREMDIVFGLKRSDFQEVPLDILFVLDTTGSMGEEIERLKKTIEIIHMNLTSLPARPRVRFGMVLYKDRGDEYITRTIALTENLDEFREALAGVRASGGGDSPEDLQAALESAVKRTVWTEEGIRLCFVITDAQAHLDYPDQTFTYDDAAREARERGIKLYTVGTGGLPLSGEILLRQIAQYTAARYIFLTYGEEGESEGGSPGSVSHHTGANYQTDKLETIIIRFTKEELSHLTDAPLETPEGWFTAEKISDEERDETLRSLFVQACGQLLDYSTYNLEDSTAAAVMPIRPAGDGGQAPSELAGEYLTERLLLTLRQDENLRKRLRLTEREDLQSILDELELQLTGLTDDSSAARVGEILGAEVLISGTLYKTGDSLELYLKMIMVETAEIMSVTKAVLDPRLLP
ncbi:MAG: VWA domain-containing protein, partial [Spirochaetaceae bacterium]|nr:VWA domain-containing protein [Spirochaetaceae bacterium]